MDEIETTEWIAAHPLDMASAASLRLWAERFPSAADEFNGRADAVEREAKARAAYEARLAETAKSGGLVCEECGTIWQRGTEQPYSSWPFGGCDHWYVEVAQFIASRAVAR